MLEMQGWEFVSLFSSSAVRILPAYQSNISKTPTTPIPSPLLHLFYLSNFLFLSISYILIYWWFVSPKSSPEIWALLALLSCIRVFQSRPICRVFCLSQNRSMAVQEDSGPGWTPPPPSSPAPAPASHNKIFKFTARITRYNPLLSDITVSKGAPCPLVSVLNVSLSAWSWEEGLFLSQCIAMLAASAPVKCVRLWSDSLSARSGGEEARTDFPATTN